ncbi:MAG: putative aldehyde dehydrogenase [Frankiales bacterium]|nr:putative aldehyde dehydrogenase [Frankiales bacterium]
MSTAGARRTDPRAHARRGADHEREMSEALPDYDGLFIAGRWQRPAGTGVIEVHSPASELPVGTVPDASPADVDAAVAAARTAFDTGPWPDLPPAERIEAVARLATSLRARSDELAATVSAEVGSPLRWARGAQVATALGVLRAYRSIGGDFPWEQTRTGLLGNEVRVRQVPVGVVAAVVPWNAPLFTAALKLAPALTAGCTVVLKPSPDAPLAVLAFAEAAVEAGLPPGVLNIVPAGAQASEHLVSHPGVDKVSFTGSTSVGRRIGEVCGRDVRRCTLELGGKAAALLLDDVVLDESLVRQLVDGAMAGTGQICMAQSRILVPRARYAEVVDALGAAAAGLRVGDPADEATDIGPLISAAARTGVEAAVEGALAGGARLVTGGRRPADQPSGWFLEPTVLADVAPDAPIAQQEVFGPVAVVLPYDSLDEGVAIANSTEYGLSGSVWTADPARGAAVAARFVAGSVAVNSAAPVDLLSPFGGMRRSGIGREGGPEGLAGFLEPQSVVLPAA